MKLKRHLISKKNDKYSDDDIAEFLEQRFDAAKGDIKKHVDMLISEF